MPKNDIVAALDMGSSQISCAIGRRDEVSGELNVLGAGFLPCRGLRGGVVININETAHAVSKVIEQAEEMARESIQSLYIGIRGHHLQAFNHHGALNIARTDKEITPEDVSLVIENAKAIPISSDREIIHTLPQEFALDRQTGVPDPIGMEGSLLEVDVHLVTASSSHLNNIWKAINRAGFKIVEPISSLLAVGDVVISPEERELGCLLLDMGGQSILIGIYSEGSIRYAREIPIGSDFITKDISYGLRTSLITAKNIKEKYGVAMLSFLNGDEEDVEYTNVDGRTVNKIRRSTLVEVIQPRVEEIFNLINDEIKNSGYIDYIAPGGIVMTGGGAKLQGMVAAAEQVLGLPTRLGMTQGIHGHESVIGDLTYATVLGLLNFQGMNEWSKNRRALRKQPFWKKAASIFEEIF
ncbi:MAG: cell division protein FtsA [bacterium]